MGHYGSNAKRKVLSTQCLHFKKVEKAPTSDLTEYLKALEQNEADSPRRNRRQEIIKLKVEINKIETNKIQRINEAKSWFFEKSTTQINPYPN